MLFEHGSEHENTSNEPCIICMTLYTESVADQTDHFAVVFDRENVAYGYDVVTFENTQPTPFCLWSPAGKGLTSWLSFVVSSVSLSLSHWYPGSGVVLDCIDS